MSPTEFNGYNDPLFNIRTRSLNNLLYWLSQIFGSLLIGLLLDRPSFSRRTRAFASWIVLFALVFIVHIWAYFYQRQYTRATQHNQAQRIDWTEEAYIGRVLVYILMGLLDAMWQTTAYWLMGAMSNDTAKLAHFVGICKSFSVFASVQALLCMWRIDHSIDITARPFFSHPSITT